MSDYDLPELPSDDELGITDEDHERLGDDVSDDGPELSAEEMEALLGDAPKGESEKAARSPRREPDGPRSRWRGPVTLALLVGVCFGASARTGLPDPVPANAPDTAFSSARAMAQLVDIARSPHPIGSPEHERVRGLLVDRLRALGLEPVVQTAPALAEAMNAARAATVRNVVARLPGSASTGAVLMTAHYDTRELAPGAADDGSGLVAILETLRAVQAGPPLRNDVIVLFTDAEEPCLCGARAFVDGHPWIDDVSVVLSFEMRGAGGPSIMFETKEQNGWIVRSLEAVEPPPFANSMAYEVYRRMPNNTDFTVFREAGKQGLNFATLDRARVYHQATDTPENLSEATLQHHGVSALGTLRWLGDADLRSVDAPDAVYLTVPVLGLVVYEAFWVVPISAALLALALLAWVVVRAGGARIAGIGTGLGVAVLGGALSFGMALWLRSWLLGSFPEAGSLAGSVLHSEGWWILAATAASFMFVTTAHGVARKWLSLTELALGALAVPLALALWLSFSVPLAAMNVQWPVAAAVTSLLIVALLRGRASGTVGWLAALALAAAVLVMLVPLVELVWLAMSARLIAVLAVVVVLGLHLCLPALDALRHPNAWWAPVTALVVLSTSVAMALRAANPSADRPAPSTLVYAYEHGTGSALWATDPAADPILDRQAIEWAAGRAGGDFPRTRDMSDFGYSAEPAPVTDAPLVNATRPSVLVEEDIISGSVRRVVLTVRSNIGAELLRFQPEGGTRIVSLNGQAIEEPASLEWAEHYGEPEGPGVVLELSMPAAEPIGLDVIEHLLRPRELLGPAPFERPDHLAPDVSAMSDRAVFKYSVAAYADPRHSYMPVGRP